MSFVFRFFAFLYFFLCGVCLAGFVVTGSLTILALAVINVVMGAVNNFLADLNRRDTK